MPQLLALYPARRGKDETWWKWRGSGGDGERVRRR